MSPSSNFFAVVSGVGSGTGRSVALRFAQTYPVALLARTEASYQPIVDEIKAAGGEALGFTSDASDAAAVESAFASIKEAWPDRTLAAAVYNANAGFAFKPFLELTEADLDLSYGTGTKGLFLFAQKTVPLLLSSVGASSHPPTLIVTGATASLRGSAKFGAFAAGKFGQRALTQSLAREFAPQGVHVASAIIDGPIDTPSSKGRVFNGGVEDGAIKPDSIADSYWYLHTQHRSCFTHELDIRSYVEKF